jgi:hypothetical protein
MSGFGLTRSIPGPHQQREIAGGCLKEELLVDILSASHAKPVQAAGIKLMREVPLDPFSALPL